MMIELYWIDDDFDAMFYIVQGIIKKLWRLDDPKATKVKSVITILGNASIANDFKDVSKYSEEAENDIIDLYSRACFEIDGPKEDRPTFNENKELIENVINFFPENLNDKKNGNDQNQGGTVWENLKRSWGDPEGDFDEENYKTAKDVVKNFIEKSGICENSKVGIDIVLMKGDIERIDNQERILSIELYEQLRESGIPCFLFSTEGSKDDFIQKCEEIYKVKYKNEDNLKIFDRKALQGKETGRFFTELAKLLSI